MIESSKNEHIKNIIKLRDNARERKKQKLYIVEGPKMVFEALSQNLAKCIYISEAAGSIREELRSYSSDVEVYEVSEAVFKTISDTVTPQGIIALVCMREMSVHDVICAEFGIKRHENTDVSRLLILEDIQDPGNLGTMIRTAEAAGFNGILMTKGTVSVYNPKVVRSTMGALFRLPFAYADNIDIIISACKEYGVTVYGMALSGNDIRNISFACRSAFVIGNESNGIKETTLKQCSENILIPMYGITESLNAAVAAGIVMYLSSIAMI